MRECRHILKSWKISSNIEIVELSEVPSFSFILLDSQNNIFIELTWETTIAIDVW